MQSYAYLFAIVLGLLVWMLAWCFLFPRFLGKQLEPNKRLRWYYGLIYPGINAGLMIFPGSIFLGIIFWVNGAIIPCLIFLFIILGGASIGFFSLIHGGRSGVNRGKAIRSFIYTCLTGSASYLILILIFAKLSNAI